MPKNVKVHKGKPGLVGPATEVVPGNTGKGLQPSTGASGRGSLVSPQENEARGEGGQQRGSQKGFKGPKQSGRVHAIGPAEHVN